MNLDKIILIACYRNPYSDKSLEKMSALFERVQPSKVIVLSISEIRKTRRTVESYLGRKDTDKLKGHVEKDQNIRSAGYADIIIKISKDHDIPTEKIVKTGDISEIIRTAIEAFQPSHVIIHPSNKSRVDKFISKSVQDALCKNIQCQVLMLR